MSRVMSRRMDRDRPLWEYWFCEGSPDGRWALLSKVHHSLVDGVSGTDLYQLVLDPTPTPRPAVPDTWHPAPRPRPWPLTAAAALRAGGLPRAGRAAALAPSPPARRCGWPTDDRLGAGPARRCRRRCGRCTAPR